MTDPMHELRALVGRHAQKAPAIPGMELWRSHVPVGPTGAMYEPKIYVPLQGTKRISAGERTFEYGAGQFVLVSTDVPVVGEVVEASEASPYLAVAFALERETIAALLLDLPPLPASQDDACSFVVTPTSGEMIDALLRFVRLLDAPEDIPILAPMIERELLYRILRGPRGAVLRQLAHVDSRLSQIQRAVKWIRAHLAEPLPVETLASIASMSVSSFHRHFKAVTGFSPLAYHKQVRLEEARVRLRTTPTDVASVAFAVGYESTSQFSREYARQFGAPPTRDPARSITPRTRSRPPADPRTPEPGPGG